jgi:hypothetical protein
MWMIDSAICLLRNRGGQTRDRRVHVADLFPIIQVNEDAAEFPETLGTKEKFWVVHEGVLHLLKFGRAGTGEDWAEKAACELCGTLGLPHAHYLLARFRERSCVLSPTMVPNDGRLILGNELINAVGKADVDGARVYRHKEHTVSRVLASLALYLRPNYLDAWSAFIGYLMFDAWIGNTDRHYENWGLIIDRERKLTLAPTFDHASSLGRELSDDTRTQRLRTKDMRYTVHAFAERARSALFENATDTTPLTPMGAFLLAARANREAGFRWLEALSRVPDPAVEHIFDRFPPAVLSLPAKQFAIALLGANKQRLLGVLE